MLNGKTSPNFKRSVFLTESAYYGGKLNYQSFCGDITKIAIQLRQLIQNKGITGYKTAGNWAAFTFMTDTIPANSYKPFTYDFDDFTGIKDWSKQFVTKLLKTHSGNCHSLPFLYKIICEEIGSKAFLALAPNHVYIKHLDEKNQWTNVELTNPGFPRDQWIIKEMAISVEAIKKNIYMNPLTEKESVAMTMFDLACGYKSLFGYDKFVLQVSNTALKYYPKCVPLVQLRANCLLSMINKEKKKTKPDTAILFANIALHKRAMADVNQLGYKDMPIELYRDWVQSVEKEKKKRGLIKSNNQQPIQK
ncbi:MAG: hypothetical protein AAGC65_07715 [Mucilaginibacter sp.]|uniref:hypothetical protein n=1 Tax=Mucilaginibacter sp. TaxID=1882438 RepID=UPI0031A916AF